MLLLVPVLDAVQEARNPKAEKARRNEVEEDRLVQSEAKGERVSR